MQRTGSTTKAQSELSLGRLGSGVAAALTADDVATAELEELQRLLPKYDPRSEFAKKEVFREKAAENAVHLIPLVLVLCAAILWFFSDPVAARTP